MRKRHVDSRQKRCSHRSGDVSYAGRVLRKVNSGEDKGKTIVNSITIFAILATFNNLDTNILLI